MLEVIEHLEVQNQSGIHLRPAASIVKTAGKFRSEVLFDKDGRQVNGKSIVGLTMLSSMPGDLLTLIVRGDDAEKAAKAIRELFDAKFHEEDIEAR